MSVRIFCDFDGTITTTDNILLVMEHFNPPGWRDIVSLMMERRLSIRRGVGALFSLLSVDRREEIIALVLQRATFREGFVDFLQHCHTADIPFYVVSGGIDFFIDPLLQRVPSDLIPEVYCNRASFSGERITLSWPYSCDEHCTDDCGLCKTSLMRSLPPAATTIMIGDSITDFGAARCADIVFARSHLARHCTEQGLVYDAYESFFDIMALLKKNPRTATLWSS